MDFQHFAPPLLVAIAVPAVVLLAGTPKPGAGVTERLLVVGAPMVNAFPIMAVATGAALAFGILRMVLQRPLEPVAPQRVVPVRLGPAADDAP